MESLVYKEMLFLYIIFTFLYFFFFFVNKKYRKHFPTHCPMMLMFHGGGGGGECVCFVLSCVSPYNLITIDERTASLSEEARRTKLFFIDV